MKFYSDQFILSAARGENPEFFFTEFQLMYPVVAPPSGVETRLIVDAKLQTFPYPTIS